MAKLMRIILLIFISAAANVVMLTKSGDLELTGCFGFPRIRF